MAQIKLRRDIASNWTTVNPILGSGEQGYETDTGAMKIGDGSTSWNNLPYFLDKVIDGQWTPLNNQLANNVTWNNTVSEATYDISSYLPNDNYNYEVIIAGQTTASATQQKFCTIQLKSDIHTSNLYLTSSRTTTTSTINVQNNATIIIPVGPGRYITQYASTSSNASGVYSLWIKGYRRIGTNA